MDKEVKLEVNFDEPMILKFFCITKSVIKVNSFFVFWLRQKFSVKKVFIYSDKFVCMNMYIINRQRKICTFGKSLLIIQMLCSNQH